MNVTRTDLPKSQVKLTIEVSKDEMIAYMDATLRSIRKKITLPGFRKGEAPIELVQKHVGPAAVWAESVEHAINESYREAIQLEKLMPLDQAKVELVDENPNGDILSYEAIVSIMPDITLPDYQAIARDIKAKTPKVTKKELAEAKEYLLKSRATKKLIDRKARKGDSVVIDYTLTSGKKKIDQNQAMTVEIGEGRFIPGFEEELIGLAKDDTKKFDITFPKEYHNTDIAGKKGTFDIAVKSVEEISLPNWDDAFALELTNGSTKTIAEIEQNLSEGLEKEKKTEVEAEHKQTIVEKIMEKIQVEFPEALIEGEKDRIIQEMEQSAMYSGETLDSSLEKAGKTRDEVRAEIAPQAESRVLLMLLLRRIADKEGLKADESEVMSQMSAILARYPKEQAEKIDQAKLRLMVEGEMIDKITLDYLAGLSQA